MKRATTKRIDAAMSNHPELTLMTQTVLADAAHDLAMACTAIDNDNTEKHLVRVIARLVAYLEHE